MHITTQFLASALGFLGLILAENNDPVISPLSSSQLTDQHYSKPPTTLHVPRPKHSQCYNYFLEKRKCVYSAQRKKDRCTADGNPGHEAPHDKPQLLKPRGKDHKNVVLAVSLGADDTKADVLKPKRQESADEEPSRSAKANLVRRYDTDLDSFTLTPGNGICGEYNDNQPGACLWASAINTGAAGGGWLNGTFTKTCGRQLYIQRKGDPKSVVYAPVIDGCEFNTHSAEPGCTRIAFTKYTFNQLKPTTKEKEKMVIDGIVWDFNNIYGDKPDNAAP